MNLTAQEKTLQEKLGYDPQAKLLIVHADDAGVSQATNRAVISAFRAGAITSTAIMVPCPWFPGMARIACESPEYDFGLHLTFTSEWNDYKWGSVASSDHVQSLLDEQGYFYATHEAAVMHAIPREVEIEFRAQIEKALAAGIRPSHFDTHMNTVHGSDALLKVYLKLGEEYRVPVMVDQESTQWLDSIQPLPLPAYLTPKVYCAPTELKAEEWSNYYDRLLAGLEPGFHVLILHLASDEEETRAMTRGHEYFDYAWRQRDLDYILSDAFRDAIRKNDITLITWGDIQQLMYP